MKAGVSRFFGRDDSQADFSERTAQTQVSLAEKHISVNEDYKKAIEHYSKETYLDIDKYYSDHASELVYCHQHNCSFIDFQKWCQYQDLLGDKLSYEHHSLLDAGTNINILSVEPSDKGFIYETRHYLDLLRKQDAKEKVQEDTPRKPSLSDQIKSASSRSAESHSSQQVRTKPIDIER